MPPLVLTGDRDRDLAAVAQRTGRVILAAVPSLSEGLRRVLRESVNPRTVWTLALYLGAWAYRSKSLRLAQLVSEVPTLSAYLNQSADFGRFERDLMLADSDAGIEIAAGSFARAAGTLDPGVLLMLLRTPVWKRLELALSAIPIDASILDFFDKGTTPEPRAETGPARERTRAQLFDAPLYSAGFSRKEAADDPTRGPSAPPSSLTPDTADESPAAPTPAQAGVRVVVGKALPAVRGTSSRRAGSA